MSLFAVSAQAQPQTDDFLLSGDTRALSNNCLQLTQDLLWSSGGIWYKEPIDLGASFRIDLRLMMGCQDEAGADGMVFVFSPYPSAAGYQGEGMGFAGLQPSLGVEVDTWQNEHLGDPTADHVAIMRDGYVSHFYNLAGPIAIPNVEDCKLHEFSLIWDADRTTLSLELDGSEVVSHFIDAVKDIFYDDPKVYMGVTAATGKYTNRHEICFDRIEIIDPLSKALFSRIIQAKLKRGLLTSIPLTFGSDSRISDGHAELYKLANLLNREPTRMVEIDVHVPLGKGSEEDLEESAVRARTIKTFLEEEGIDAKRIVVRPLGSQFHNLEGRELKGPGRIDIRLFKPKT
ncbi:MAG: hypothetical protein KTR24_07565 [Saprospiraceae bacterium]|nr:hypothetical protein [Saprospiraceae bacterium]